MVDSLCYKVISVSERTVEISQDDAKTLRQKKVIVIPDSIEYAGKYYKVVAIGNSAFENYEKLNRIILPKTVVKIKESAFRDCYKLDSVLFNGPVESIEDDAFRFCSNLKHLTLPLTLTNLGACAFECSGLQSIVIPPNLRKLREYCFGGCMSLKEIYFSDSKTDLDISETCFIGLNQLSPIEYAYYGRMVYKNNHEISWRKGYAPIGTLKKATIGPNLRRAHYLFRDCIDLEEVEIPNTFTHIGYYLFSNCTKLKTLQLPENLKKIDNFAFMGTVIKNFVIPDKVTEIGLKAFYNSNIETIVLPECLNTIGENCFNECGGLKNIVVKNPAPIEIPENAFSAYSYLSGTLYVPNGKKELYMNAKCWSEFQKISEGSIKYNLTYIIDGKKYKSLNIEEGETITPETPPIKDGYTFSGWSDIPETMPAQDVTITGTFTANKYKLTYIVGGSEFKTYEVEYGTSINQEAFPEQEGYTFSGWSEIPETMPAHDVTVTGLFTVNTYTLTYMIDGEVYKTVDCVYGTAITPEDEPTKVGYTFSGWSETPETMPAHDVTITGQFERHYDIGNVASVIDFILNENYDEGNLELYDMNGDGELNIGDLILIVRKVLDSASKTMTSRTDVECIMPDLAQYTAAQFVVNVPQNVREQDIRLTRGVAKTHQMMCKQIEPGRYAVVIYSLTNSKFAAEGSGFIEVDTKDAKSVDVDVQDVVLARHTGETARFGKLLIATAIADVKREEAHSAAYDLRGWKQEKASQKGVYIKNGKKIVVR